MSWKKKFTKGKEKNYIYPHYHCIVCNKMIEKGSEHIKHKIKEKGLELYERYCSQECYEKVHRVQKKSKKGTYLRWIIIAGIGIASIVVIIILAGL
jgi:predicted nucleic acid-binding Zn ribbon protein